MAHPSADPDRHTPLRGDIHNPIDTYLPEITTPKPTTPRDSYKPSPIEWTSLQNVERILAGRSSIESTRRDTNR